MKEKRMHNPAIIGASSLLTIFVLLCLTVFALLSLSSAQADKRLSDASLESLAAYYEADLAAEKVYARLRTGEIPAGVEINDNTYSFVCPITDRQSLHVTVINDAESWSILRWQAVAEPEPSDNVLSVWSGGEGVN